MLFFENTRKENAVIVDVTTKKNTISGKADPLSDRFDRVLDAPHEATLVKLCERIDNLLDTTDRNRGLTKHYLTSTDELIGKLSMRASLYGYDTALNILVQIRNANLKKMYRLLCPVDSVHGIDHCFD